MTFARGVRVNAHPIKIYGAISCYFEKNGFIKTLIAYKIFVLISMNTLRKRDLNYKLPNIFNSTNLSTPFVSATSRKIQTIKTLKLLYKKIYETSSMKYQPIKPLSRLREIDRFTEYLRLIK